MKNKDTELPSYYAVRTLYCCLMICTEFATKEFTLSYVAKLHI